MVSKRTGAATALGAASLPAWAHSPIPGIGNFYNGALHPLVSPAQLIVLLALGLVVGQGGLAAARAPLVGLLLALLAGLAAHRLAGDPDTDRMLLAMAAVLGLAVAAAWRAPAVLLSAMAALVGVAVGVASGPTGLEGSARWTTLAGTLGAALLLTTYVAAMVTLIKAAWLHIAVRVIGSWLAAAALLVLALSVAR
jgi:urease accessory protein